MTIEEKKQLAEKVIELLKGITVSDAKDVLRYASMGCENVATITPSAQEVL